MKTYIVEYGAILAALLWSCNVAAQAPPSVVVGQAQLVDPDVADSYYANVAAPPSTLTSIIPARSVAIKELARSLGAQTRTPQEYGDVVFEYLHNNVATEFRYGLSKGALGALIDQSGTPFDQAQLMVELLREASIIAGYRAGKVTLTPAQFTAWTGITSAASACRLLADGGIPAMINGSGNPSCNHAGSVSSVVLGHIWVAANGKLYDPSFKAHTASTAVAALSSLQCGSSGCAAGLKSAMLNGAQHGFDSSAAASYVQGVNLDLIDATLLTYATNLETHVRNTDVNMTVERALGLREIDVSQRPVPASTLPYQATAVQRTWTGAIPDAYRTRLRVQFDNLNAWYYADEIATRNLVLNFDFLNTNDPVTRSVGLYLGDMFEALPQGPLATSTRTPATASNDELTLQVDHPYAAAGASGAGSYMDQWVVHDPMIAEPCRHPQTGEITPNCFHFSPTYIVHAWGRTGHGLATHRARGATAQPTVWDFGQTAAAWLVQSSRGIAFADAINATVTEQHSSVGAIVQWHHGSIADIRSGLSVNSRSGSGADRATSVLTSTAMLSALEGSAFEQIFDSWGPSSSVAAFGLAAEKQHRFYEVTAANKLTALAQTSQYSAADVSFISSYVDSGMNVILPANGQLGTFSFGTVSTGWTIAPMLAYSADAARISYVTTAKNKGAAGPFGSADAGYGEVAKTVERATPRKALRDQYSIDLDSGALTHRPEPDLVTGVGAFPYSLAFQRQYSSAQRGAGGVLGDASWRHQYEISAAIGSDGLQALGFDSALDATPALAAMFVMRELFATTPDFQSRLAGVFAADWLARQISGNSITLSRGIESSKFIKLPSGFYHPDPGSADRAYFDGARVRFVKSNTGFVQAGQIRIVDGHGSTLALELRDFEFQLDPNTGQIVGGWTRNHFTPSTWEFPMGVRLDFSYELEELPELAGIRAHLSEVSNTLGRELHFEYPSLAPPYPTDFLLEVRDESDRVVEIRTTADEELPFPQFTRGLAITGPDQVINRVVSVYSSAGQLTATRLYGATNLNTPLVTVNFDSLGRASSATDIAGNTTRFYPGRISGEQHARGELINARNELTTQYTNLYGKPTQVFDGLGRATTHEYYGAGPLRRTIRPEGDSVEYSYDVRSNLVQTLKRAKPGSGYVDIVSSATYMEATGVHQCVNQSVCNLPATLTDERGKTTIYAYDGSTGLPLSITSPAVPLAEGTGVPQTSLCYETFTAGGLPLRLLKARIDKATNAANRVTAYSYDSGNKYVFASMTTDPGPTFVPSGTLDCATANKPDALALTTSLTFDSYGNVSSINGPRTDVVDLTSYTFDRARRLTRVDGPLNAITRYTYAPDGSLLTTRQALVANPTDGNPANAWPTDLVASQWSTETRDYWPTRDLMSVADPQNNVTHYYYDSLGRENLLRDPEGRGLATVYDAAGQVDCLWKGWETLAAPSGCGWNPGAYAGNGPIRYSAYSYSLNGKPIAVQDANNNVTDLAYDGFDRLQFKSYPHPVSGNRCTITAPGTTSAQATCSEGAQQTFEQFSYDDAGNRLTWRTRRGDIISNTYDDLGRMRTKSATGLATVTYGYNLLGQPLAIKSPTDSPTHAVSYDYDDAGRKSYEQNLLAGMPLRIDFRYDQAGNRSRTIWPGGDYWVHYEYDALNRMRRARENSTSSNELAFYDYDELSRRKELRFAAQPANKITYSYEPDSNLDVLTHTLSSSTVTFDHGYNHAGQLRSIKVLEPAAGFYLPISPAPARSDYSPDRLNRYAAVTRDSVGYSPAFDTNGNLIAWGPAASRHTYTYDAENRLRSAVVTGDSSSTYDYDPLGRRIAKTVDGVPTYYLLDGDEEIAEYDAAGNVMRRYIAGPAIDDRIARVEIDGPSAGKHYYRTNHQGSVIITTDDAGVIRQQLAYDEYGMLTTQQPPASTTGEQFRFTGRRYDEETGLYYYRARYYSPEQGRFLQPDPIGYEDDVNLYLYARNDPLNLADPRGTDPTSIAMGYSGMQRLRQENPAEAARIERQGLAIVATGAALGGGAFLGAAALLNPAAAAELTIVAAEISAGDALGGATLVVAARLADDAVESASSLIFRGGKANPGNLKTRPGESAVSFRDSISNPMPNDGPAVLKPGQDYITVDTSKLPPGSANYDGGTNGMPPGHVSVTATPEQLKQAVIDRDKFPE